MNRLHNQRAYLCGCIDRVHDHGKGWRSTISTFLSGLGVKVFNPLEKSISIGVEDDNTIIRKQQLKLAKKYDELTVMMKEIRNVDLRLVDISDFLVVHLDLNSHPTGTYEEIFLANRQKKPIVIHIEQGKAQAPDWLFGAIPHEMMFDSWELLTTYLMYIDTANNIEHHNRWYFFQNG